MLPHRSRRAACDFLLRFDCVRSPASNSHAGRGHVFPFLSLLLTKLSKRGNALEEDTQAASDTMAINPQTGGDDSSAPRSKQEGSLWLGLLQVLPVW